MSIAISHRLFGIIRLISSGAIGAAAMSLLASGRLPVDVKQASQAILFMQWEVLALTVAKVGADQVIFAVVSVDPQQQVKLGPLLRHPVLSICAAAGVLAAFPFGLSGGLAMSISLFLDAASALLVVESNARGRFSTSAIANLLNYPLFVGTLVVLSLHGFRSVELVPWVFCSSSVARLAFLTVKRAKPTSPKETHLKATFQVCLQQALNYGLFRSDQLFLSYIGYSLSGAVAEYLFLVRFPELVGGIVTAVGAGLLPVLRLQPGPPRVSLTTRVAEYPWIAIAGCVGCCAGGLAYAQLWAGPALSAATLAPFILNALLIFPVVLVTYSMLADGRVKSLVRNQLVAQGVGLLWLTLNHSSWQRIALTVPVQETVFLVLSTTLSWGARTQLTTAVSEPLEARESREARA